MKAHHIDFYKLNFHEIPGEPHAVCVVVPTKDHFQVASWFLEKGVHVLVEKPVVLSSEEFSELLPFARERKVILFPVQPRRFDPRYRMIREEIKRISELKYVKVWERVGLDISDSWRAYQSEGGVLWDVGVHLVDLLIWLMGFEDEKDLETLSYGLSSQKGNVLVYVRGSIIGDGRVGEFEASWIHPESMNTVPSGVEVIGDDARIYYDDISSSPLRSYSSLKTRVWAIKGFSPLYSSPLESFAEAMGFFVEMIRELNRTLTYPETLSGYLRRVHKTLMVIERMEENLRLIKRI